MKPLFRFLVVLFFFVCLNCAPESSQSKANLEISNSAPTATPVAAEDQNNHTKDYLENTAPDSQMQVPAVRFHQLTDYVFHCGTIVDGYHRIDIIDRFGDRHILINEYLDDGTAYRVRAKYLRKIDDSLWGLKEDYVYTVIGGDKVRLNTSDSPYVQVSFHASDEIFRVVDRWYNDNMQHSCEKALAN